MRPTLDALLRLGYAAAGAIAQTVTSLAPSTNNKLVRTFAARRGLLERYQQWGAHGRDPGRKLLWLHAPSVGEGLQARPLIEIARARRPDVQIAYTHFSPSAEQFAGSLGADFADYLPFDTADNARACVAALRPAAVVFSKLDVWPALTEAVARTDARLGMVSGTVAQNSGRLDGVAARLLRPAYSRMHLVGAVSDEDGARLVTLGVPSSAVRVTGDTRYDQVWARARRATRSSATLAPLRSDQPTLVAGSTWPADESVLLAAWVALRTSIPGARLIIAPHELSRRHLDAIEQWAAGAQLDCQRMSNATPETSVVLVDRMGVLGDLYGLATVAYVGGGFHRAGLHSVLEPAAFGVPVLVGPLHHGSRDAGMLIAAGGAREVRDAQSASQALLQWLGNPTAATVAGAAAQQTVEDGLGAAERSWAIVEELLAG